MKQTRINRALQSASLAVGMALSTLAMAQAPAAAPAAAAIPPTWA